jgi:hypothetical protein
MTAAPAAMGVDRTPDMHDPRAAPGGAQAELDGLGPGDHG